MKRLKTFMLLCAMFAGGYISQSCRKEATIIEPEITPVKGVTGFYLLNEGLMGYNNASLDYYDYAEEKYKKDIFGYFNPTVTRGLGDVGNDLQIYGSRLYAVINGSDLVEVMDVATAKEITTFKVTNGRYITFRNGKAYVSAYVAPTKLSPDTQLGAVFEYDTATYTKLREVVVGYQPEEPAIVGDKMYVPNSGGYRFPYYDNTVSVIDLNTFTVSHTIEVGPNLHRTEVDSDGDVYVCSRGDYYDTASNLYVIDTETNQVKKTFDIPVSDMCINGDSLYVYSVEWSYYRAVNKVTYAIINTKTEEMVSCGFITDGTDKNIKVPYGLAVDPVSKDIYVTDAGSYVTPGTLYCFDKFGKKKWSVTTGDVPSRIAFVKK